MKCHAPKQVSFCHNTVCHRAFSLLSPTARLTLSLTPSGSGGGRLFPPSVAFCLASHALPEKTIYSGINLSSRIHTQFASPISSLSSLSVCLSICTGKTQLIKQLVGIEQCPSCFHCCQAHDQTSVFALPPLGYDAPYPFYSHLQRYGGWMGEGEFDLPDTNGTYRAGQKSGT